MLVSMGVCPRCNGGHNTACYAVYSDGGSKCFSCGHASRAWTASPPQEKPALELPQYTTNIRQFSVKALLFFNKYYIDEEMLQKYRVGYSVEHDSVLYPLLNNYTQERFLGVKRFKTYGIKPIYITPSPNSSSITIVEDFLSCMRVGVFTPCMCLFGTNLSKQALEIITHEYNNINIWLDGDEPGQKAASKIYNNILKEFNIVQNKYPFLSQKYNIRIISTQKDPKEHTANQIKDVIKL